MATYTKLNQKNIQKLADNYGLHLFLDILDMKFDQKYESWLAEDACYLEQHIISNLPTGLIHGDLFYGLFLFCKLLPR